MRISKYWKGVIASSTPVLLAVQAAAGDGQITSGEWIPIGIAVLAAVGVVRVPNRTPTDPDTLPAYRG
jgi:hypothetical protein